MEEGGRSMWSTEAQRCRFTEEQRYKYCQTYNDIIICTCFEDAVRPHEHDYDRPGVYIDRCGPGLTRAYGLLSPGCILALVSQELVLSLCMQAEMSVWGAADHSAGSRIRPLGTCVETRAVPSAVIDGR